MSVPNRRRRSSGNNGVTRSTLHVPRGAPVAKKWTAPAKEDDAREVGTHESCSVGDFRQLRAWQEAIRFVVLSRPAIRRLALDYLSESELRDLHASRANCARMVAGLLRRLRDD